MLSDLPPTATIEGWEIVQYAAQCSVDNQDNDLSITKALWNGGFISLSFEYKNPGSLIEGENRVLTIALDGVKVGEFSHKFYIPEVDEPEDGYFVVNTEISENFLEKFVSAQSITYSYKGRLVKSYKYRNGRLMLKSLQDCMQRIYQKDPFVD